MMSLHFPLPTIFYFAFSCLLLINVKEASSGKILLQEKSSDQSQIILNVHIVPHTHDDVGWLKTVDQYYYGLNNTIQHASVQSILDSTVRALLENSERKFTYVEMAFFTKWWEEQTPAMKDRVKELVKNRQLSFANGGWCMHDEATTFYIGMIDQTTRGHDFLKTAFDGYTPRVGWQLDPFGHSATQASLLSAEVGFDAIYFGRIDHQDLLIRQIKSECEGVWRSSPNLGSDAQVFFGLTGGFRGNYGPPGGFDLDGYSSDEPFVDGINIDQRVSEFVDNIIWQANISRGRNIMLTMGSDFQYENAFENFKRLDSLIHFVNQYQQQGKIFPEKLGRFSGLNVFYSNPEIYTEAKLSDETVWNLKEDDFFPYSDCNDCFWTGYFTSRPNLKRFERVSSSFLQAARQLEAYYSMVQGSHVYVDSKSPLESLESAISVVQHHDGVSGTSKQHVAYDYAFRVDSGMKSASKYAGSILKNILRSSPFTELIYCQDLNVSKCEVIQNATLNMGTDVYVVAYNALVQSREEIMSVPVSRDASFEVQSVQDDTTMQSVLLPSPNYTNTKDAAPFMLHFDTGLIPPLGAAVFRIRMTSLRRSALKPESKIHDTSRSYMVSNDKIQADFKSGMLQQLCLEHRSVCVKIKQIWGYYTSFNSSSTENSQNSGAYIFRPFEADQELKTFPSGSSKTASYVSELVCEIHTTFSNWVTQIIRIKKNAPYLEMQYIVGPIPDQDGIGKEIVTRYSSENLQNNGVFYTDSNGREFMKRQKGKRISWDLLEHQPVAGNYYPVNAAIYIHDDVSSLTVLNDRSQGGSSLKNGTIELMVHRRTKHDDARGVGEPIDETDGGMSAYPPYGEAKRRGRGIIVQGIHRVMVGSARDGAANARSQMDGNFSPLHLFFATALCASSKSSNEAVFEKASFSMLQENNLPPNVMLVTFAKLNGPLNDAVTTPTTTTVLVRIGHQYASGEGRTEDDLLSSPASVDLSVLFPNHQIVRMVEKTLSNNQERSTWEKKRFHWNASSGYKSGLFDRNSTKCSSGLGNTITICPMKICTFEVEVVATAGNDFQSDVL